MAKDFEIKTIAAQPIATIRVTIRPDEMGGILAQLFPEVAGWMAKTGIDMAGAPFALYHSVSDEAIDLEAGCPVEKSVTGEGRIRGSDLPAGEAAVAIHMGPFEQLRETSAALFAWIAKQDREPAGPFWESYQTDPQLEPDPAKWRTEICVPLRP